MWEIILILCKSLWSSQNRGRRDPGHIWIWSILNAPHGVPGDCTSWPVLPNAIWHCMGSIHLVPSLGSLGLTWPPPRCLFMNPLLIRAWAVDDLKCNKLQVFASEFLIRKRHHAFTHYIQEVEENLHVPPFIPTSVCICCQALIHQIHPTHMAVVWGYCTRSRSLSHCRLLFAPSFYMIFWMFTSTSRGHMDDWSIKSTCHSYVFGSGGHRWGSSSFSFQVLECHEFDFCSP